MDDLELAEYQRLSEEQRQQDLIDFPLKEGYVRIYMDHTGRWFEDHLPYKRGEDPLYDMFHDEVQKEINKEVIESVLSRQTV